MTRRLLIFTLAISMLILAACGSEAAEESTTTEPATGETTSTEPADDMTTTTDPGEPTVELEGTIVVWDYNYGTPAGESFDEVARQFMDLHPNVVVEHVNIPVVGYSESLDTAFTTQSGPDLVAVRVSDIPKFEPRLTDLSDRITPDVKAELHGWAAMNPELDADGAIYGLPYSLSIPAIYYNKELFSQAGLDPERPPSSLSELIEYSDALLDAGITPLAGGNAQGTLYLWWFENVLGGVAPAAEWMELALGDRPWTDEMLRIPAEMYMDFIDRGYFAPNHPELWVGDFSGYSNFVNGEAAIAPAYTHYRPALLENDDDIGVWTNLAISANEPFFKPAGPVLGWSVPTFSQNPDVAYEYARFISGVEAQQLHLDIDGQAPTNVLVDASRAPNDVQIGFEEWKGSEPGVYIALVWDFPAYVMYRDTMLQFFEGSMTLDDALEATQAEAEQ